jgi:hypothetical protein
MLNARIAGASPDDCDCMASLAVAGLPRQISRENAVTVIIADNHII